MASDREANNNMEESINLKGLRSLLQKSLNHNELEVVSYTARKLLPIGENYCSILLKIEATISKFKSAKLEKLHLVAKTNSPIENSFIDWRQLLPKEIFMYTELVPAYRSVEREAGMEESELFDTLPKYIAHRYSLRGDDKVDESGLLLMENLVARHFYVCDRFKGLDFDHARVALAALARYHALGIALKQKRPKFFERVVAQAQVLGIEVDQMKSGYRNLRDILRKHECFAKYLPTIGPSFDKLIDWDEILPIPQEPWASITHGDFWTNNILFRRDTDGNVQDVKFVDFQTYFYTSPLRDLPYFLCASLDETAKDDQCFGELLNVYYDTFVESLERVGCETSRFTRKSFDRELKDRAIEIFPIIPLLQKFMKHEVKAEETGTDEIIQNLMHERSSDGCRDNMLALLKFYENKKWL